MLLSEQDVKILTLEKTKRANDAVYGKMDNGEQRERLWKKSWNLMMQINAMIYDAAGMYRADKRHLLKGGSLDISLLDK